MKKSLLDECVEINKFIKASGLVKLTWGNASIISKDRSKIAIKPSGVDFSKLKSEDLSIVEISSGNLLSGLKPSVDTDIHLEIYRNFNNINCVIHNHSKYATSFAQAGIEIPIYGTTHADYFPGPIPLVLSLEEDEYEEYELNIGRKVVSYLKDNKKDPDKISAVLLENHGVLLFSSDFKKIRECAIVLEEIAEMSLYTRILSPDRVVSKKDTKLFDKHFQRKNGKNKYYGQ